MSMSDAKFESGHGLSATTTTANSKDKFFPDDVVYRKADVTVAATQSSKQFPFDPYKVLRGVRKYGGTNPDEYYLDANEVEALCTVAPVNPDKTGPGNLTTPYFVEVQNNITKFVSIEHESQLLNKADMLEYFAAEVGNL